MRGAPEQLGDPVGEAYRGRGRDAARAVAGAWGGLAIVQVVSRARLLSALAAAGAGDGWSAAWTPVAAYQDLFLVAVLALASTSALDRLRHPSSRRLVVVGSIVLAVVCALYSALSTEVFLELGTYLTARVLVLSDGLRGVRASLVDAASPRRVATILAQPLFVCVAAAVAYLRSSLPRRGAMPMPVAIGCAVAGVLAVVVAAGPTSDAVRNPHLVMLGSLLDLDDVAVPAGAASPPVVSGRQGTTRPPTPLGGSLARSNVVLIVLESAGARYLAPYGATVDVMPMLSELAAKGVLFERVHAQQPRSSSAMAALLASLSPWSRRQTIPRAQPAVAVPGLADVLATAGYRSAFLHSGDLSYENERTFLAMHGFATVLDATDLLPRPAAAAAALAPPPPVPTAAAHGAERSDARAARRARRRAQRRAQEQFGQLRDRALVAPALDWIDRDPGQPFLLVVWTIQAHAPYVTTEPAATLDPRNASSNRYLNALREGDRMIADLLQGLAARCVLDSTLVVVTGDHGESFGAHGVRFHGRALYDDEVLVPLVLSHPRLRPAAPERSSMVAQQIDVAPTVVDLLGLSIPAPWQGDSLFATGRSDEAFLVSVFETTRFGLVRGERKYVFDERLEPLALHDRSRDPDEREDLASRPEERAAIAGARQRLAGWLRAQDAYLEQLFASGARE